MKVNISISYLSWSSDPHIRHLLGKLVISISYWSKFFFPNFIWSSSVICSLVSPLPYSKHIIDTFFHPQCKLADKMWSNMGYGKKRTSKDFRILHSCLCLGQCSFCSSLPTYPTHLHPPHIFKFPSFEDTGQIPNQ